MQSYILRNNSQKFQIHGRRQRVCRRIIAQHNAHLRRVLRAHKTRMNALGEKFERGWKAVSSRAKLSTVNYRVFCCTGCPSSRNARRESERKEKKKKKEIKNERGDTRRSARRCPASSQTRIRVHARTRFLHCCLAWIAGVRVPSPPLPPLIITICCRVRVSCYAALTRVFRPICPPP